MTETKRRFVRQLVRFQNAVDEAQASSAEAYQYDREFDGGEFSGPALARELERVENQLARRFGFASAEAAYGAVDMLHCGLRQPATMHGFPMPIPDADGLALVDGGTFDRKLAAVMERGAR